MVQEVQHDPIDAVITWVDGLDPAHLQKRQNFMGSTPHLFHENATNPHRWACNGEIYLCLSSLEHNAPWLRKIWIVVDDQSPDLSRLSVALQAKIHLVDHTEIFANHGASLGSMHGTPKLTPLSAKAPLGSLRPFHMPELADGAAQKKMADVIVGALGGRGKVQLSKYGDPAKGELIDEGTVENVMQSLMDADDELGEFLFSMIDEVERDVALRAVDAQGPPEHAFGSPRKKSKN